MAWVGGEVGEGKTDCLLPARQHRHNLSLLFTTSLRSHRPRPPLLTQLYLLIAGLSDLPFAFDTPRFTV